MPAEQIIKLGSPHKDITQTQQKTKKKKKDLIVPLFD